MLANHRPSFQPRTTEASRRSLAAVPHAHCCVLRKVRSKLGPASTHQVGGTKEKSADNAQRNLMYSNRGHSESFETEGPSFLPQDPAYN